MKSLSELWMSTELLMNATQILLLITGSQLATKCPAERTQVQGHMSQFQ